MPTALAKLLAKRLGEKYRALFHGSFEDFDPKDIKPGRDDFIHASETPTPVFARRGHLYAYEPREPVESLPTWADLGGWRLPEIAKRAYDVTPKGEKVLEGLNVSRLDDWMRAFGLKDRSKYGDIEDALHENYHVSFPMVKKDLIGDMVRRGIPAVKYHNLVEPGYSGHSVAVFDKDYLKPLDKFDLRREADTEAIDAVADMYLFPPKLDWREPKPFNRDTFTRGDVYEPDFADFMRVSNNLGFDAVQRARQRHSLPDPYGIPELRKEHPDYSDEDLYKIQNTLLELSRIP